MGFHETPRVGILISPKSVFSTDLLLLGERHECQWLHGLILQNSSKLLILHVLWDLKIVEEDQNQTLKGDKNKQLSDKKLVRRDEVRV